MLLFDMMPGITHPQHREFYNCKAKEVIKFCQEKGIDFHIKEKTITE